MRTHAHAARILGRSAGLALLLSGCGSTYCFSPGDCVELPSNAGFCLRWAVVAFFGLLTAGCLYEAYVDNDRARNLLFAALAAALATFAFPGFTRPSVAARLQGERLRAGELEGGSLEEQIRAARLARRRLVTLLEGRLDPLIERSQRELAGYLADLGSALPGTGASSHRELLESGNQHKAVVHTLARAAMLRTSLARLRERRASIRSTLDDLDQSLFRLEHVLELRSVGAEEDPGSIRALIASSDRLLDETLTPPEKQDVAASEAELFAEIVARRAP